ncbi:hypothetical protein Ga0061062_1311, partial [Comamonas thiooxydans]
SRDPNTIDLLEGKTDAEMYEQPDPWKELRGASPEELADARAQQIEAFREAKRT